MSYVGILDKHGKVTKRAILKARVIWDNLKATEWPLKNIISFETYMKAFELWLATKPTDLTEDAFKKWFDVNYPQVKEQMDILQAVNNMEKKRRQILKRQLDYSKREFKDQTSPLVKSMIERQKYAIEHGGAKPPKVVVQHKGYLERRTEKLIGQPQGPQYGVNGALDMYMREIGTSKQVATKHLKALAAKLTKIPFRKWSPEDTSEIAQYPDLYNAIRAEQRKNKRGGN